LIASTWRDLRTRTIIERRLGRWFKVDPEHADGVRAAWAATGQLLEGLVAGD
jgi:hypothetical protein